MVMVNARINGELLVQFPEDLYIPPDALEIFLEAFEGPLDLLLYLIKKQNLDILNIPIAKITQQYMQYIELMSMLRLELAAEYLLMAAMLAEIKSRMLLPRHEENLVDQDHDPRAELIRRLQQYECFRQAAISLDALPRVGRDLFLAQVAEPEGAEQTVVPELPLRALFWAMHEVLQRAEFNKSHAVQIESLSIRERMSSILQALQEEGQFKTFISCFQRDEGKLGVVVSFIAILELLKQSLIDIVQHESFGMIYIKGRTA